nr:hypothetical protein [Chroococcidiopsis sp. CCMEE 29]
MVHESFGSAIEQLIIFIILIFGMYKFLSNAYFQNQFIPFNEAKISIATHALHYGTLAFGGLRGIPAPQDPKKLFVNAY